jgi:DNA gyrase subunit A
VSPRKLGLVVTELPYLVGPEKVIEKIKDGVNNKKLQGISDVIDLTDRTNGLKLVIELKTGFDPQVVLDLLYRYTPMEDSFGINNVTLVDGRPNTLGIRDLLGVYLAHRVQVTRRRTINRLGKKKARLHLVEGLLIAIVSIDEVIQVIRGSDEVDEARSRLMSIFELSEIQAEYILELRLRRLTKFSKIELETEKESLEQEIKALELILSSDSNLRSVVSEELAAVADKYGDARRTVLLTDGQVEQRAQSPRNTTVSAELADSATRVCLTATGLLGRFVSAEQSLPSKRKKHDVFTAIIDTTTRSDIGAVTNLGRIIRVHVGDIPDSGELLEESNLVKASDFFGLGSAETLLTVIELNETNELALATKHGVIKRVVADYPAKDDFEVIALRESDELVGAVLANGVEEYVMISSDAQVLRFKADGVRAQGRPASGVAGMNLSEGAFVIAFGASSNPDESIVVTAANSSSALTGTDAGSIKASLLSEFPAKGRATSGVRGQKLIRSEDQLYFAAVAATDSVACATDGKPLEIPELAKRDVSGATLSSAIAGVGTNLV